jgi:hypothetical protein
VGSDLNVNKQSTKANFPANSGKAVTSSQLIREVAFAHCSREMNINEASIDEAVASNEVVTLPAAATEPERVIRIALGAMALVGAVLVVVAVNLFLSNNATSTAQAAVRAPSTQPSAHVAGQQDNTPSNALYQAQQTQQVAPAVGLDLPEVVEAKQAAEVVPEVAIPEEAIDLKVRAQNTEQLEVKVRREHLKESEQPVVRSVELSIAKPADQVETKKPKAPAKTGCDEVTCLIDPGAACCTKSKEVKASQQTDPLIAALVQPDKEAIGEESIATEEEDMNERPARLSSSAVRDGFRPVQGQLSTCSNRHQVRGTIRTKLEISKEGKVRALSVKTGGEEFQKCLTKVMKRARFTKTQEDTTLSFPLVLR